MILKTGTKTVQWTLKHVFKCRRARQLVVTACSDTLASENAYFSCLSLAALSFEKRTPCVFRIRSLALENEHKVCF